MMRTSDPMAIRMQSEELEREVKWNNENLIIEKLMNFHFVPFNLSD